METKEIEWYRTLRPATLRAWIGEYIQVGIIVFSLGVMFGSMWIGQ